jgi:hypothetical protein
VKTSLPANRPDTQRSTTMIRVFTCVLLALYGLTLPVHAKFFSDSTQVEQKQKKSNIRITTRLHSLGLFMYGGQIANDNPGADLNFTYERKTWSFLAFKAVDLYQRHSDYNFTLALLYKNFRIGKRLVFTPNIGFVLDQRFSVADRGSDAIVILLTSYKLSSHFTIDHCARLGNVMLEPQEFDWLNRFRLVYTSGHLDLSSMVWHNNNVFDNNNYMTVGGSVAYSRIKVAKHVMLSSGVTGLMVAETSDENNCPRRNGVLFTLAAVFD